MARRTRMIRNMFRLIARGRVPLASAAMSYHLTMTLFPMIICLYALFGQRYTTARRLLAALEQFLTPDAADLLQNYLLHVTLTRGRAVLVAAVSILAMSASAAVRALQDTIAEMQGGHRARAWIDFLISFLLAAVLLAAVYFSLTILLTGQTLLSRLRQVFPKVPVVISRSWIRFGLLGGVALLLLWGLFSVSRQRRDRYPTLPGALLSTACIVVMTNVFSVFIAASARYSLVYGSLASVILLMFWLYLTCLMIFIGAAFNVALRDAALSRVNASNP